ncbi:MAG TPA: hypothetical protein VN794_17820 [Methylomirabilota bacterium]|jgi:hypothetical protein|nr:hypothetical protein [Methylomirabilota bacterium]
MTIGALIIPGAVVLVAIVITVWVMSGDSLSPDPWDPEIEKLIQDPAAEPLCHRCLTPQSPIGWFCPECGTGVGPYNNYMPFVYAFSEGEVLRAGVLDHVRRSPVVVLGFLLYSAAVYAVFAPIYWYYLFSNFRRHPRKPVPEA